MSTKKIARAPKSSKKSAPVEAPPTPEQIAAAAKAAEVEKNHRSNERIDRFTSLTHELVQKNHVDRLFSVMNDHLDLDGQGVKLVADDLESVSGFASSTFEQLPPYRLQLLTDMLIRQMRTAARQLQALHSYQLAKGYAECEAIDAIAEGEVAS